MDFSNKGKTKQYLKDLMLTEYSFKINASDGEEYPKEVLEAAKTRGDLDNISLIPIIGELIEEEGDWKRKSYYFHMLSSISENTKTPSGCHAIIKYLGKEQELT